MKFVGRILALDLATRTGWCSGRPGQRPKFGSVRFGKSRPVIYRSYREWLDQVLLSTRIDLVVFESPIVSMMRGATSVDTIKLLSGLAEHTEEMCHDRVECREASVGEIRRYFLGPDKIPKGEGKNLTMAKCESLGFEVGADDNAADAIALWHYQIGCLRPDLAATTTPLFSGTADV